jgi:hypothetical protein
LIHYRKAHIRLTHVRVFSSYTEFYFVGGGLGFIGYVDGRDSWENVTLADNRNKTGLSPAIGWDNRKRPPRPSDDI